MKILAILATLAIVLQGCEYMKTSYEALKFWQVDHPDNAIEEIAEEVIEVTTGKDIDLTPFSGKEKHKFKLVDINY